MEDDHDEKSMGNGQRIIFTGRSDHSVGGRAELAWKDGCISHANNGILGEVFNAVMTSLCFVEKDIHPAFDKLTTYMRGEMREITMDARFRVPA